jgi:hypothetical protein
MKFICIPFDPSQDILSPELRIEQCEYCHHAVITSVSEREINAGYICVHCVNERLQLSQHLMRNLKQAGHAEEN